jgi:hypothetical protein
MGEWYVLWSFSPLPGWTDWTVTKAIHRAECVRLLATAMLRRESS